MSAAAQMRVHRERAARAMGQHAREEWNTLMAEFDWRCVCCGGWRDLDFRELTRDHIVPLALGGSDSIDNIQPLCQRCNSRKGVQPHDGFSWKDYRRRWGFGGAHERIVRIEVRRLKEEAA